MMLETFFLHVPNKKWQSTSVPLDTGQDTIHQERRPLIKTQSPVRTVPYLRGINECLLLMKIENMCILFVVVDGWWTNIKKDYFWVFVGKDKSITVCEPIWSLDIMKNKPKRFWVQTSSISFMFLNSCVWDLSKK